MRMDLVRRGGRIGGCPPSTKALLPQDSSSGNDLSRVVIDRGTVQGWRVQCLLELSDSLWEAIHVAERGHACVGGTILQAPQRLT